MCISYVSTPCAMSGKENKRPRNGNDVQPANVVKLNVGGKDGSRNKRERERERFRARSAHCEILIKFQGVPYHKSDFGAKFRLLQLSL